MRSLQLLTLALLATAARGDLFVTTLINSALGPMQCDISDAAVRQCVFSGENTLMSDPVHYSITMSLLATYGDLKATIDGDTGTLPGYGESWVLGFSDSLTVLGFSGPGFFKMNYVSFGTGGINPFAPDPDPNQLYPFTGGLAFPVKLTVGGATRGTVGDAAGMMSGELLIGPFSFYDSNMQPLANYRLVSASGTAYDAIGAVPEPSTLLLLATVVCLVALTFAKQRYSI